MILDGTANAKDICVTCSAGVNLTVFARYSAY
jgi:hypothetical protein